MQRSAQRTARKEPRIDTLINGITDHLWAWLITVVIALSVVLLVLKDLRDGRRTRVTEDVGRTRINHADHARTVHRIDPRYGGHDTSGGAGSASPG